MKFDSYKETEQEIKIQAQKQQIEKMSIRLTQLQEQYKSKEAHMMERISHLTHIEEKARGLCQKILDKDRREMVLGANFTWGKVSSEDMIDNAIKSYRQYCEKRTTDMQKLGVYAGELNEKNDQLEKEVKDLKAALEEVENGTAITSEQKKNISMHITGKKTASVGGINVDCEEEEGEEEVVEPAAADTQKKEELQKRVKARAEQTLNRTLENTVRLILENISENDKQIIRIVGEGMSLVPEIKKAVETKKIMSASTAARTLQDLADKVGLMEYHKNVNFPGSKNVTLFKLSTKGKIAYRMLFNNPPAESEWEKIVRYHARPEHGYGIRSVQRLLSSSNRYNRVQMFSDPISLPDGTKYIPDLVCTRTDANGKQITEYFEYERCKQKDSEYMIKFGKIAMITDEINVIVANPSEHEKMQRLLAAWAEPKKKTPGYPMKIIRLTNYNRIEKSIADGKPYHEWWYIEDTIRDFKMPIGTYEN